MKLVHKCEKCGEEAVIEVNPAKLVEQRLQERQEADAERVRNNPQLKKYHVNCAEGTCNWQDNIWAESLAEALEMACIEHNEVTLRDHDQFMKYIYSEAGAFHGIRGEEPKHN